MLQRLANSLPQPLALHFQTLFFLPVETFNSYLMEYSLVSTGLKPLFRGLGYLTVTGGFILHLDLLGRGACAWSGGRLGGEIGYVSSVFCTLVSHRLSASCK